MLADHSTNALRVGARHLTSYAAGNLDALRSANFLADRVRNLLALLFANVVANFVAAGLCAALWYHFANFVAAGLNLLLAYPVANFVAAGLCAALWNHLAYFVSASFRSALRNASCDRVWALFANLFANVLAALDFLRVALRNPDFLAAGSVRALAADRCAFAWAIDTSAS